MKRETGKILVFVVLGCLIACGTGVGVWRSTAPDPTLATSARESATPGSEQPTSTVPLTVTTTATTTPVSPTATDPREGPVEARTPSTGRITVDRADPLLPPNAHIPAPGPGGTRPVQPTTAFRPPAQPVPQPDPGTPPAAPETSPGQSTDSTETTPTSSTTTAEPGPSPSSSTTTTVDTTEPSPTPTESTPSHVPTEPSSEPSPGTSGQPDPGQDEGDVPPPVIEPPDPPLVPGGADPGTDAPDGTTRPHAEPTRGVPGTPAEEPDQDMSGTGVTPSPRTTQPRPPSTPTS